MNIKYQKLRDNAILPAPATKLAGGLDITAAHIEYISDNEVLVYTGLAMQPPPGYRIRFSPRSSFTKYNWILQNSPCLGDADYTGEYMLRFRAIPTGVIDQGSLEFSDEEFGPEEFKYEPFPYKVGDRCAQMWVEEIISFDWEESKLRDTERGDQGFGSTDN